MYAEAVKGALVVTFGERFALAEANRLAEQIAVFMPVSQITLDFTPVRSFDDQAMAPLGDCLKKLHGVRLTVRGLTARQLRKLAWLGVKLPAAPPEGGGSDPPSDPVGEP